MLFGKSFPGSTKKLLSFWHYSLSTLWFSSKTVHIIVSNLRFCSCSCYIHSSSKAIKSSMPACFATDVSFYFDLFICFASFISSSSSSYNWFSLIAGVFIWCWTSLFSLVWSSVPSSYPSNSSLCLNELEEQEESETKHKHSVSLKQTRSTHEPCVATLLPCRF